MKPAVFFDRDGVLNRAIEREGRSFAPLKICDFSILPEAASAIEAVHRAGFLAIVVTNQPEISRGLLSQETLEAMHEQLKNITKVDDIFICPHDSSEGCSCHKPKPGLIHQAASKWNIDVASSCLIGDRWRDIGAGKTAGCYTILIERPYSQTDDAHHACSNLTEAITHWLSRIADKP